MTFEHSAETHEEGRQPSFLGERHETPAGQGPLSWRDVYTAVRDSEDRVVTAIKEAVAPLWDGVRDQERRLRTMEQGGAGQDHEIRLRVVESQVNGFASREHGVMSTLSAGKTTILLLCAILTPIISAVIIVATASPHA
jgi:hypothetical protein